MQVEAFSDANQAGFPMDQLFTAYCVYRGKVRTKMWWHDQVTS